MNIINLKPNRAARRRAKFNKKNDTITLEQFIELMRCPKQRDEKGRSKKKGIRRKFKILLPEHTHVIGAILLCDVIDEKKGRVYKKGTKILIDGHTRRVIWTNELEENLGNWCNELPEEVTITYYYVSTWKELCDLYDHFDNASDTEKTNDKWFGACMDNEFQLKNEKLKQVMAVQWAAHKLYPTVFKSPKGMSLYDLDEVATRFKDALLALDSIGDGEFKKGKKGQYQVSKTAILTSLIISFQKHNVRLNDDGACTHPLYEVAQKLNRGYLDNTDPDGKMDGVSHIVSEYTNGTLIPDHPFNFNTIDKELSFCLYWIEKALKGGKYKQIGNPNGQSWTTYVNRYVIDTYDAINNALNVSES
tara:strand:- start:936 stop:2021 length:1086 start_codon:yes stop_codon:yes gene_type:complete